MGGQDCKGDLVDEQEIEAVEVFIMIFFMPSTTVSWLIRAVYENGGFFFFFGFFFKQEQMEVSQS